MKHLKAVLVGALTFYALSWDCLAAPSSNDARTETVRFADLDLARPSGAQELYRRIEHAARDVCEPIGADHYGLYANMTCRKSAIARAIRDVGAPLLTEHHQALMY
jgi:UrcA family protein